MHGILREREKHRVRVVGNGSVLVEQKILTGLLEMGVDELRGEVE